MINIKRFKNQYTRIVHSFKGTGGFHFISKNKNTFSLGIFGIGYFSYYQFTCPSVIWLQERSLVNAVNLIVRCFILGIKNISK